MTTAVLSSLPSVESRLMCIESKSSQSELDSQEWWCTSLTLAVSESLDAATREAAGGVHARAAVEAAGVSTLVDV